MVATVGIVFRLTEFAVRNFKRIEGSITKMEKAAEKGEASTRKFNVAMSALASGAAVGLVIAAKKAADLEDVLARLETVTRSTTQSMSTSMAGAEASARKFSTEYAVTAEKVIDAQFQLATAGVAVEEQIVGVQAAFKLAEATVGDFTQTTALLGQFLNTFGKNVELGYLTPLAKMQRLTDVVSSTVQRFQVTLPVLAQGFKFIIGPATQLNLKFEEVAVSLGILNTAGFRGTLAGTALSNMFNKLGRAVEKLDLDPSQFQDLTGNLKSMASFLRAVNEALADTSPIEAQSKLIEVFDIRAGRVIKTLANNVDALERLSNEFEVAKGATERMAATIQSTTSKELGKFINTIQNMGTSIGKVLNSFLRPFIVALNAIIKPIAMFVEQNRFLVTMLALVATGLAAASLASLAWFAATKLLVGVNILLNRTLFVGNAMMLGAAIRTKALAFWNGVLAIKMTLVALAATSVIGTLQALAVAFGIVGIVIAAATALFFFGKALVSFLFGSKSANLELTTQKKKLQELKSQYTDSTSKVRSLASEMKRLGRISRLGGNVINPEDFLGDSGLAKEAAKLLAQDLVKNTKDAIDTATKNIGTIGIFDQIAKQLSSEGAPKALVQKLSKALQQGLGEIQLFDPKDSKKSLQELIGENLDDLASATDLALRSVTVDIGSTIAIFKKLEASTEFIRAAGPESFFGSLLDEASLDAQNKRIELISKNLVALGNIDALAGPINDLKTLGFHANLTGEALENMQEEARIAGTDVGKAVKALTDRMQQQSAIAEKLRPSILGITGAWRRYQEATSRVRTSTTRLDSTLTQLEKGIKTTEQAVPKINKRLAEMRSEQDKLQKLSRILTLRLERLALVSKDAGATTVEEIKKIQKQLLSTEGQLGEIEININAGEIRKDLAKAFKGLTGFDIGSEIGKSIKKTSSVIQSSIADVLTGAIDNADFAMRMQNSLRKAMAGRAAIQIGNLFATKFINGIENRQQKFDTIFTKVLERLKPRLDNLLDAGKIQQAGQLMETAMDSVAMATTGIGLGLQEANKQAGDLEKQLNKISIAQLTANSRDKAFLNELVELTKATPKSVQQNIEQQARIAKFIQRAHAAGADEAVTFGERRLEILQDIKSDTKIQIDISSTGSKRVRDHVTKEEMDQIIKEVRAGLMEQVDEQVRQLEDQMNNLPR